jgi:hypothetical protein
MTQPKLYLVKTTPKNNPSNIPIHDQQQESNSLSSEQDEYHEDDQKVEEYDEEDLDNDCLCLDQLEYDREMSKMSDEKLEQVISKLIKIVYPDK